MRVSEIVWYRGMRVRRMLSGGGHIYGTLTHWTASERIWLVVGDHGFDVFSEREVGSQLDTSSGKGSPSAAGWEPDPESRVAILTTENKELRAEVAMISSARDADRAMLARIIGCEQSDASTVVLLERAEVVFAGLRAEVEAARKAERAAIVAWLREPGVPQWSILASGIARGDHEEAP